MTPTTTTKLLSTLETSASDPEGVVVSGIAYRSDRVQPGDAFFCVVGLTHDGHEWASDAVRRGASALVVERRLDLDVAQYVVEDTRAALALAAARFYREPSRDVAVIGITGTNGKTTTAYLMDSILRSAGITTGLIGTVETRVGDRRLASARTTPESADLHRLLAEMRDEGIGACSMEISSHAIDLHRIDAVEFAAIAFTNLTQDHLDYHNTMEMYYSTKRRLFTDFRAGAKVVDIDDAYGRRLASEVDGCTTVGRDQGDIHANDVELTADGASFVLVTPHGSVPVVLPLAGDYNVSNALVAAACADAMGISLEIIAEGLRNAPQVPGRLERVDCGQDFSVIVDYAHTPDSIEKACAAVREVTEGNVILVFGCGGDRDPDKRPLMGRAAVLGADRVVVTSDNPRSEDPVGIILQIEDGMKGGVATYEVEVDRRKAICRAIMSAKPGDSILIAGKGHENYQIFSDRTVHFDDREVAREALGSC